MGRCPPLVVNQRRLLGAVAIVRLDRRRALNADELGPDEVPVTMPHMPPAYALVAQLFQTHSISRVERTTASQALIEVLIVDLKRSSQRCAIGSRKVHEQR